METVESLEYKFLKAVQTDMQQQMIQRRLNASGKTSASLKIVKVNTSQQVLRGSDTVYYLIHGRRPGKFPPIQPIRKWVQIKIRPTDISVNSLAFLIARKIARRGTDIYLGKRKGIDMVSILTKRNKQFKVELIKLERQLIMSKINNKVKLKK